MNKKVKIFAHKKPISSIFEIYGDNENALTAALTICMPSSENLLKWILKKCGLKNIKRTDNIEINYQLYGNTSKDGITDIEIFSPGQFHLIIEAKVGGAIPGVEQCEKYIPRFELYDSRKKCLAILLDSGDFYKLRDLQSNSPALKKLLKPLLWTEIYDAAQKIVRKTNNHLEEFLLKQLCHFIEEGFYMKAYDEEVWIVQVKRGSLGKTGISTHDLALNRGIYFHPKDRTRRKAIYFVAKSGDVDFIQKIMKVEYNKIPAEYVPELAKESWGSVPHTIFLLGKPVKLPNTIKSGRSKAACWYSDFDILINSKSIVEAHKLTNKRKNEEYALKSSNMGL